MRSGFHMLKNHFTKDFGTLVKEQGENPSWSMRIYLYQPLTSFPKGPNLNTILRAPEMGVTQSLWGKHIWILKGTQCLPDLPCGSQTDKAFQSPPEEHPTRRTCSVDIRCIWLEVIALLIYSPPALPALQKIRHELAPQSSGYRCFWLKPKQERWRRTVRKMGHMLSGKCTVWGLGWIWIWILTLPRVYQLINFSESQFFIKWELHPPQRVLWGVRKHL